MPYGQDDGTPFRREGLGQPDDLLEAEQLYDIIERSVGMKNGEEHSRRRNHRGCIRYVKQHLEQIRSPAQAIDQASNEEANRNRDQQLEDRDIDCVIYRIPESIRGKHIGVVLSSDEALAHPSRKAESQ